MGSQFDDVFSDDLKVGPDNLESLRQLGQMIQNSGCRKCPLHEERGQNRPVPGEGRGKIMFVGHRIGRNEERTGRPAIGDQSKYGFKMFAKTLPVDHDIYSPDQCREDILDYAYVTNGARCGGDASINVRKSHWNKCSPLWLQQEIHMVDPEIIVFWKKQVARVVLGGNEPGTGEIERRDVYGRERAVMTMKHPVQVYYKGAIEEGVVADFNRLTNWLWENGHLNRSPDTLTGQDRTHHLVRTTDELEQMKEDLWDKRWIAYDTETSFRSSKGQEMKEIDKKKGALRWFDSRHQTICYQVCGLSVEDGENVVNDTWTVAMRFRDRLTSKPYQEISPEEAIDGLKEVLAHAPETENGPVNREITTWNHLFDGPVSLRDGLDLLGLTSQQYPIRMWDGRILLGRMNEHLAKRQGMSSLDGIAKSILGESKGSFSDKFDPQTFAYNDIRKPKVRKRVLEYTGEDPRKTLLCTLALFDRMEGHVRQHASHTTREASSIPELGFEPFPIPGENYTGSRLRDVAVPVDHQMIPIISEMRSIGYKLKEDQFEKAHEVVESFKRQLITLIQEEEPGYNPNSSPDAIQVMERMMREAADLLEALRKADPENEEEYLDAFQIKPGDIHDRVRMKNVKNAFEMGYGELDGQKATVLDKFAVFMKASLRLLMEQADEENVGWDPTPDSKYLDVDRMETFFDMVFVWKQIDKAWGTYFERFRDIATPEGMIHPVYKLMMTLSGRFSGNFQNVPRGGDEMLELIEEVLELIGEDLPEDEDERRKKLQSFNWLDVRQLCEVPQSEDLNRMFELMNFRGPDGELWEVQDEPYVDVFADFAAQEDRTAYAQSGDDTKQKLLENTWIDTHFYNVSFCFGGQFDYDTSTEDGTMNAYEHFTKHSAVKARNELVEAISGPVTEELISEYNDENFRDADDETEVSDSLSELVGMAEKEAKELLRKEIKTLKSQKGTYKKMYRTPMKNVHYASTYGAAAAKLHTLIAPIFEEMGVDWKFYQTEDLKEKYDELYRGVTEKREEILADLDDHPYIEYPIYGTIRHASNLRGEVEDSEYLSTANAYNQGFSAYITKQAMIRMRYLILANAQRWNLVQAGGDRYVGISIQVHDEIGVRCPEELSYEVSLALESAMKMIVEPKGGRSTPYWDTEWPDARGQAGWMSMPDQKIEGKVLYDADAEVKRTVAKADVLADGTQNTISLMDEPETYEHQGIGNPGVNEEHPLVLCREDHSPDFVI